MKNKLKYLWIATTVSFLLSIQYVQRYTDEKNRMLFFWARWDGLAIVFSAFLIGLFFFLIYLISARLKRRCAAKIVQSAFITLLGIAIIKDAEHWLFKLNNYSPGVKLILQSAVYLSYTALFYALCVHFFTQTRKVKNSFVTLCLILSPIIPIFLINSFGYKTWTTNKGNLPVFSNPKIENTDRRNTFIFIFDEWSYAKSYKGRELIPIFKNLRQFQETAVSFHKAYSPSGATLECLPNIIFQSSYYYGIKNNRLFFKDKGTKNKIPLEGMENIFTRPHQEKRFTACAGFYHPYADAAFLGKEVDFADSISAHKIFGEGFLDVTAYHMMKSVLLYSFHFFPQATRWVEEVCLNQYQLWRTARIHKQALSIIEKVNLPTFALFHYSVPHGGFIYNQKGANNIFQIYEETPDTYMGNVAYLDKIIGEIISTLRQSGKFDNSLIIMTSDHSWRMDPDLLEGKLPKDEGRHVPLLIKFPHQKKSRETEQKLNTAVLFEYIKAQGQE